MSRSDDETGPDAVGPAVEFVSGRALWRRCCVTVAPAQDENARLLDLAAFADGLLDEEERDRVTERIAADPAAASDVVAARELSSGRAGAPPVGLEPGALERIVARVCAGIGEPTPENVHVLAFAAPPRRGPMRTLAEWSSLAAGIVIASWLGFAMGSGASRSLNYLASSSPSPTVEMGEVGFLPELLDPAIGFLRDSGEGRQT